MLEIIYRRTGPSNPEHETLLENAVVKVKRLWIIFENRNINTSYSINLTFSTYPNNIHINSSCNSEARVPPLRSNKTELLFLYFSQVGFLCWFARKPELKHSCLHQIQHAYASKHKQTVPFVVYIPSRISSVNSQYLQLPNIMTSSLKKDDVTKYTQG